MSIIKDLDYQPLADESDPDDYRPNSQWALVIDPRNDAAGFVESLALLFERMAPGDRIPLHTHSIDEVIVIDEGQGEVTVGNDLKSVSSGTVVFVPAGTPHGTRNLGDGVLKLHAVFPSQEIPIRYLERNPAPGTAGAPPQPPFSLRLRELLEGDPAKAIVPTEIGSGQ
ncbi:MAG TPA: cupin domain-containing protein [Actinomycetota bacterium]|nr:cupin domain-containing protein [Actinomycetota bacterium]